VYDITYQAELADTNHQSLVTHTYPSSIRRNERLTVAILSTERPLIAFEKPLTKAINPSPLFIQTIQDSSTGKDLQYDQCKRSIPLPNATAIDLEMWIEDDLQTHCSAFDR
jgi:hypothetical protein